MTLQLLQHFQDPELLEWIVLQYIQEMHGYYNGLLSIFPRSNVIDMDCFSIFPRATVLGMGCF